MIDHPALQDTTSGGQVSREAALLAADILNSDLTLNAAIDRVATHILTEPRVEVVVTALTRVAPEDTNGWVQLGGRAWVREWTRPGSGRRFLPPPGAGPEAALSQPWLSQFARSGGVVLVDSELLPPEAAQDREELNQMGVRSLIATAYLSDGEMFGSLSAAGIEPGGWPETVVEDMRLLNATITARLALEHSRRSLVEAIEADAQARSDYQQFSGALGHELRTPLTTILGYTEGLLDDAKNAPAEVVRDGMLRDGQVILRACEQLLSTVDSLLGTGRALSSTEQRQRVVVSDAVADVIHWHRTPAQTAHVEMHVSVDTGAMVWAHASGVRHILANLLGNGIAHHRVEGGNVRISTEPLLGESGQPMVRIIVRDDGPGLAPDQLMHVFEPFVRFADSGVKGSGLGLSISRTIAERDGGALRGESTPGVGSSFWVELPAFVPQDARAEPIPPVR